MANQQNECNNKLPSAVYHNYVTVSPSPPTSCFYDPFWAKNDVGAGIHSLQLHHISSFLLHSLHHKPWGVCGSPCAALV